MATRQQVAQTASVPAPLGGWNARDPLANMAPTDAYLLDNWEPSADRVRSRNGYAAFATLTGITGDVGTLAVWNGGAASELWALSADTQPRAFNVTAGGATAANAGFSALAHTGTASQYSTVMFNNVAGYYLYVVDELGTNPPAHYNGAAWAAPAITGVTATNIVHVNLFKYRLLFVEQDSLNLHFLPPDAIAGAVSTLPLGGYFNEGGYLLATGTWTMDAGEGIDDRLVAITSTGQVAIFQGTDPTSASSWSLVGIYKVARPMGRRCLFRYGSDLYILTTDGMYSMDQVIAGAAQSPQLAITDKIRAAFQASARTFGNEAGWKAVYYPRGRRIIVNVPSHVSTTTATQRPMVQYVMDAQTKSWCRYTGMHARDWALMGDSLYFSVRGGYVRKADAQNSDDGSAINVACKQAYNYFGGIAATKYFVMQRPTFETDATNVSLAVGVDTDFKSGYRTTGTATFGGSSATWDTSPWDTTPWDADQTITNNWGTYGGMGYCASLQVNGAINGATVSWFATDWVFEVGGIL